ncbi:MAG: R3H domain-containing nucleic acid-binding protein [Deltaproteobacteria bacterium]
MNESKQDAGQIEAVDPERDEEDGEEVEAGDTADDGEARGRSRGQAPARPAGGADDVPPDERSREALEFAQDIILKMGMDCDVSLQQRDDEDGDIHIQVTGPDAGRIIGKKGQVLAAVQFIVNRAMNRPGLERRYVSVDADGYRSRREDSLANMARRLGRQAVSDGQIITFEPMSPRDRRVVHLALAKFDGVVTKSEGEGDDRRVQIIPVRRG